MAPPADHAVWYRLVSVALDNGTEDYPAGDFVQTVEAWTPPSPWDGLSWDLIEKVLTAIQAGPSLGERYAMAKQAKDRWVGNVLIQLAGRSQSAAASVIERWKAEGVLEDGEYSSPALKGKVTGGVTVNRQKYLEMCASARS